jgi:pyrimidine operon attenuation protein/uracil phosphoribosyltransferase
MNTHAPVQGKTLLDADGLGRTLSRIAHEIIEGNPELDEIALVGIQTRGVPLARRLARLIEERAGVAPDVGTVDITFHRDDVSVRRGEAPLAAQPVVRATQVDFPLDGRTVVLVDDVLYTGRTIRAAIETLFDYGRPARVQLAVVVDRGHRELPIRPDYVGKNLPTARDERIQVQLVEVDEVDAVLLVPRMVGRADGKAAGARPEDPAVFGGGGEESR